MHATEQPGDAADSSAAAPKTFHERIEPHKGLVLWAGILLLPVIAFGTANIFHKSRVSESTPLGALDSIVWPRAAREAPPPRAAAAGPTSVAPVESLIAGLATRLEAEPGDSKGWALLAQSYAFLGDSAHAESAFAKAVEHGVDEADLRQRVSMARPATTSSGPAPMGAAPSLRGIVSIADGVELDFPADARLFVTAKATDGSPMPIAVLASNLPQFPYAFALSDFQTMLPGASLSNYAELALSARISRSGTASRTPNDVESDTRIVRVDSSGPIELVLQAP